MLQELFSQEAALSSDVTPGPWQGGEMARVLVSLGDGTDDGVSASPQKLSFVLVVLAKRNTAGKLKPRSKVSWKQQLSLEVRFCPGCSEHT